MFIAGIELDLAAFKKRMHKSFVFGLLTFSIPILIGFPVCFWLLGYPLITSLLTASIFATHTLVAFAGKWLSAFFTQKTFSYSNHQRKLIFGLSSSHAAATLAIILIGYKEKIIDENILNGTIILILVTRMMASFVTGRAAKAIAAAPKNAGA